MKKLLALILVGTMLSTMPVMAAKSPDASSVSGDSGGNKSETPAPAPSAPGPAVEASSVPADIAAAAAAEGKTVGEYSYPADLQIFL